jgi:hypothetical protein
MIDGLPLIMLIFVVVLTLMAFWRLVLMICLAALLTVFAVGVIETITWFGGVL